MRKDIGKKLYFGIHDMNKTITRETIIRMEKFIEENFKGESEKIVNLLKRFKTKIKYNPSYDAMTEELETMMPNTFDVDNFDRRGKLEKLYIEDLVFSQENLNKYKLRCINENDLIFPLHVSKRRDGSLVLEDGYHRAFYCLIHDIEVVKCLVLDLSFYI